MSLYVYAGFQKMPSRVCESSPQSTLGHKKKYLLISYHNTEVLCRNMSYVVYVHVMQHYCNATYMHCIKKYYSVII